MREILTTEALDAFCQEARQHPFVTIDTEFLRERTYYAQLCLVQMAYPGGEDDGSAALIDVMAEGIDLTPIYDLMRDTSVVKVFHAARQDLEIFWHMGHVLPTPLFDTQVAAMVCGYGEQVGYEALVRGICKAGLDKSSRFTDWSQRPLSDKQKVYALADVTYLRDIYVSLEAELEKTNRRAWVEEELEILGRPGTYVTEPEDAWLRLKTRSSAPRFLVVAHALAEWREREAQTRDVPRNRLLKDDALLEIASNRPESYDDLAKSRLLLREARRGKTADGILDTVKAALNVPKDKWPTAKPHDPRAQQASPALMDLLKVLLKAKSEKAGVAQKLIATMPELEAFVLNQPEGQKIKSGWRHKMFGADAVALMEGRIALTCAGRVIDIVELVDEPPADV